MRRSVCLVDLMNTHKKDNRAILEDDSQSLGHVVLNDQESQRSKYFHKRAINNNPDDSRWFVWRREDNGDFIFQSEHKTEEKASNECRRLNNLWALHNADVPNPHTCCKGLWIPNEHRWEHFFGCSNRKVG